MMAIAAFLSLAAQFGKSALTSMKETVWPFLKEHWKQISWTLLLLWAVICLLTHCSGVIDPWGRHGGRGGNSDADVRLNIREQELNQVIRDYQDTIKLMDLRIDSFDAAINLKNKQLKNIHHEVQLLSGDSLAIVGALNGVFSRKR